MLKRFIQSTTVVVNPHAGSKEELLTLLIKKAEDLGYLKPGHTLQQDILSREQSGVMELAPGIVLPHFRAEYVRELFVLLGIHKQGMPYKGTKKNQAQIVILIGIPKEGNEYLKLLASISRLMMRPDFVSDLLGAEISDDVVLAIRKCEVRIERSENPHPKKYFVILTLNKNIKDDRINGLLAEVGVELPVQIEGQNLEGASTFIPFLATFGISSGLAKYARIYMGITDEKDAAGRLFALLREEGIDLEENGMGSLIQIESMESYGGYALDLDF